MCWINELVSGNYQRTDMRQIIFGQGERKNGTKVIDLIKGKNE